MPGLSDDEVATLGSLHLIDNHPLYTMRFVGAYDMELASTGAGWRWADTGGRLADRAQQPGCSLFTASGGGAGTVYGRNFDWEPSPALLLFTDPPDAYASVSMVDIAYLVAGEKAGRLAELPFDERLPLLRAPYLPFDGMNEYGLVAGMAAVPESSSLRDPAKRTIGSLTAIRLILDGARDVDEALSILQRYNVRWGGGPPLHYLIADASGRAALVEFVGGETVVMLNEHRWHLATNHLRAMVGPNAPSGCWRYDLLADRLGKVDGRLDFGGAMDLLRSVSQQNTQWSVVYGASMLRIDVAMGRGYDKVHTFRLRGSDSDPAALRIEWPRFVEEPEAGPSCSGC